MSKLPNRRVLLGISGGIAAYKAAELVRLLRKLGSEVKVVMTKSAQQFITPLTLQALSGNPVHIDLFDTTVESGMGHIELARWADVIVIAPASAATLARCAYGLSEDLLVTLYLASRAPVIVAPAMNQAMWSHPATQANIALLKQRGVIILGPAMGSQACGDEGPGRMIAPTEILHAIEQLWVTETRLLLKGRQVMITAGPTWEALDPVRYLTNPSSGKMGFALAAAAREVGAHVTLISGPTTLEEPAGVRCMHVTSAQEMFATVMQYIAGQDIFISAAAVMDYRCAEKTIYKQPKQAQGVSLSLVPNPDIVATVAGLTEQRPFTVGFAAQTHRMIEYAKEKLQRKHLDMIAVNPVGVPGKGFGSDYNELTVIWSGGSRDLGYNSKVSLAKQLIELIAEQYARYHST